MRAALPAVSWQNQYMKIINSKDMAGLQTPTFRRRSTSIDSGTTIRARSASIGSDATTTGSSNSKDVTGLPSPTFGFRSMSTHSNTTVKSGSTTIIKFQPNTTALPANDGSRIPRLATTRRSSIAASPGSFDTDPDKTRALWDHVANSQPRNSYGPKTCRRGACKCQITTKMESSVALLLVQMVLHCLEMLGWMVEVLMYGYGENE